MLQGRRQPDHCCSPRRSARLRASAWGLPGARSVEKLHRDGRRLLRMSHIRWPRRRGGDHRKRNRRCHGRGRGRGGRGDGPLEHVPAAATISAREHTAGITQRKRLIFSWASGPRRRSMARHSTRACIGCQAPNKVQTAPVIAAEALLRRSPFPRSTPRTSKARPPGHPGWRPRAETTSR